MKNFENILNKIQEKIDKENFPVTVHLDEIYNLEITADDFLNKGIQLFNFFIEQLKIDESLNIRLDIELVSESPD